MVRAWAPLLLFVGVAIAAPVENGNGAFLHTSPILIAILEGLQLILCFSPMRDANIHTLLYKIDPTMSVNP